jgi:RNA polymerase sigma-70 factor (ECF subfamily)
VEFVTFDDAYLHRLRAADPETQGHFVRYFGELIQLKLRSRLRSPQAIEDVRQETFARALHLLRSPTGLREASRLGALVNSICNNVLFEQYRAEGRADPLEDGTAAALVSRSSGALDTLISGETRATVREVLGALPQRDRDVLKAIFLDERDKDEVCAEMGVSRDYIRVLLHRAKNSFRKAYTAQARSA